MSLQSWREYLEKIRGCYERASRPHKPPILEEFCLNCGYHRKHAVRLLNQQGRPKKKAGRKRRYGSAALA